MAEETRKGHFKDKYGQWHVDRRANPDRRKTGAKREMDHDRRKMFRRQADRELYETDHRQMIEDALNDFAEEHDGQL